MEQQSAQLQPSISADEILLHVSKERILLIEPSVAGQLSDLWQSIKENSKLSFS